MRLSITQKVINYWESIPYFLLVYGLYQRHGFLWDSKRKDSIKNTIIVFLWISHYSNLNLNASLDILYISEHIFSKQNLKLNGKHNIQESTKVVFQKCMQEKVTGESIWSANFKWTRCKAPQNRYNVAIHFF